MLIAILSDIHANREALESCLDAVAAARADRIVLLGDIVGYGADPEWCLDTVRRLIEDGAIAVRGNHDEAAASTTQSMTSNARVAIEWTRNRLDADARAFLGALPLRIDDGDRLYVHADASAPGAWRYVLDSADARRHLNASDAQASFCGHTHRPALHCLSAMNRITSFTPSASEPIPLGAQRRWLAVMGAVGQPRDGNPAAAFGLHDTTTRTLRFCRTPYDTETAARKILDAGLPEALAARLLKGH
ncbi:MAG: metallophosphatase family protein [Rhizobium sp.]|nr:metallophosphatase family protein [Rhizobium sp.]